MTLSYVWAGRDWLGGEILSRLNAAGFKGVGSIGAADVVLSFALDNEMRESIYFDSNAILSQARPGAYLVELSMGTPTLAREVSTMAQVNDMRAIDAPLFVRDITAEHAWGDADNLICLAGGEKEDIEAVRPLLQCLAGQVIEFDTPAQAQSAKAAFVLQRCATVVGMLEAGALCRVTPDGIHATRAIAAMQEAGVLPAGSVEFYDAVFQRRFKGSYTVEMMRNELECALLAAEEANLLTVQAEAAQYLLQLLSMVGGNQMAAAALSLLYLDESDSAQFGLDWSRAVDMHDHRGHDHDDDDDYYDDEDDYRGEGEWDDWDDGSGPIRGRLDGYGGYSFN